jgi:hypothetical protein
MLKLRRVLPCALQQGKRLHQELGLAAQEEPENPGESYQVQKESPGSNPIKWAREDAQAQVA